MKLSTKARHAITAMMDLALNDKVRPVTLAEISQCQGISLSYLEQLFSKLRKSDLVVGVRGPGGGYKLARHPSEISVANIIAAIDGLQPKQEEGLEPSSQQDKYVTQILWDKLSDKIYQFLDDITLQEFSEKPSLDIAVSGGLEQDDSPETIFSDRSAA